ncbi:hypothetical protein [Brevibacillus brevis]|uniref:hypothetical protein n=1 Tax=Brevibacillus brevis TaxID=1393 RepID=UPI000D10CF10|nr:hypothetical protein [Brevibacillus brevis]PSJ67257.1 hypothetical protein C7J99_21490 [Brevibacillus brevis]RED20944.1 hypothetical protein DES34_1268 [Brevibacillus brevis]GEC93578.1 hypothetical protein BBR01nite_59090 [Brevibacillus brevis]VEF92018.1 Uncharacterised protein [Brevibacillus brevis]
MIRWGIFSVFLILPIVLLTQIDYSKQFLDKDYDLLKDQVELVSWLFAGLIAIVALVSLFVGFMYDNKLLSASRFRKQIYLPYTLSLTDIRQGLLEYERNVSGDILIKCVYAALLAVTSLTILVWGTAVGFYTKYQFSTSLIFTIEAVLNFGIYAFYTVLCCFLVGLSIIFNHIKNNKDPLGDGFLPKAKDLCNIDHLISKGCDIDELALKVGPSVEFYKNPPIEEPTFEMNFHLPIKFHNFRFVISIYDKKKRPLLTCYGVLTEFGHLGEKFVKSLTTNLSEGIYNDLSEEVTGEIKIFNSEYKVVSRLGMSMIVNNNDSFILSPNRIIYSRDKIELNGNLLANLQEEKIKYHVEQRR